LLAVVSQLGKENDLLYVLLMSGVCQFIINNSVYLNYATDIDENCYDLTYTCIFGYRYKTTTKRSMDS